MPLRPVISALSLGFLCLTLGVVGHENGCGGVFVEHRALLYLLVGTMHKIALPSWNPFVLFDGTSEGEHRIHGCSDPRLIVDLQGIGTSHSTRRLSLYRSPHDC